MAYKLYDVYDSRDRKVLTADAEVCAKFMGFKDKRVFYRHVGLCKEEKRICNNGFYAKKSEIKPGFEGKRVKNTIKVKLLKNLLVPKKSGKNIKRLVKIRKGEIYLYDNVFNKNKDTIILAKKIVQIDETKIKYRDVLKLKRNDLNKYFKIYQ